MKKYLILLLAMGFILINCKKKEFGPEVQQVEPEPQEEQQPEPNKLEDFPIHDFLWLTLNTYYLWQAEVPNLSDTLFPDTDEGDQAYVDFLASKPNPMDFLENELLYSEDRFTFYSENYRDITNLLAGISKSNGLEFGLSLYGSGNDVFGYVNYIIKDSDASIKDIKRGDIFIEVDGTGLYYNSATDNNLDLLDSDTYTLGMADIIDNTIVPNDKEVALTKVEGLEEDPILVTNIIDQSAGKNGYAGKIGYLMYNSFIAGSGERLNEVFGEFSSAGVTDLVLDLRYNLGGRGYTAAILASLIYGPNENDLFFRDRYNAKIEAQFDAEDLENYFVSTTGTSFDNMDAPLNSLNLNRVYVLATDRSASASELVMVGLEPYVDVVHIGSTTVGKNQGSATFVDDPENGNFYDPDREDKINPDNQWALQPIIVTVENAAGFSDYSNGLVPDVPLEEDIANLGTLGDPNEPLFAKAIEEITGLSSKRNFDILMPANLVGHSKMFSPLNGSLVIDKIPAKLKDRFKEEMKK
jgi:C-terminal processing protease CtpA/Prc